MLDNDYRAALNSILERLPSNLEVPADWTESQNQRGATPYLLNDQRNYARVYARDLAVCEISPSLPAIDRKHEFLKVCTKDVSRSGMGFLAGMQMYPGEKVTLWTRGGKLRCQIMRCMKRGTRCFDVGAKFC